MFRSFDGTRFTTRASILICPAVISSSPATQRSAVVFPQPGRPDEDEELAVLDQEVEVVDRDRAVGVSLGDVVEGDGRHARPMLTGESFRAKALEVGDELLALGEDAALGQDSRANAALDALDERPGPRCPTWLSKAISSSIQSWSTSGAKK